MDKITFLDPAEQEFYDAVRFYNSESEGLGFEFALEIKRTLERIVQYPFAWHPLSRNTRRCRADRFPYGIIYTVIEKQILVVAVMHLHKSPEHWYTRLTQTE